MKTSKILLPLMAVMTIALTSCGNSAVAMDTTPSVGDTVFFAGSHAPDGWKAKAGYSAMGMKALTAKQNPVALTNGKCTFTQQVTFLPAYYQSRGDDYLSRQYIYDNAQIAGTLPGPLKIITTSTDSKNLEMVSATYVVKGSPESTKKDAKITPDSFRAIAVRAIDASLNTGYAVPSGQKGPYGSDATKGVPAIVLIEDCPTQSAFNADNWTSLVKSSKINLNQPVPTDQPTTAKTPAAALPSKNAVPSSTPTVSEKR